MSCFFPSRHLARMDSKLACQLGRRAVSLGRCQGHLGLECRPEYSPFPGHLPAPDRVPLNWEAPPYQSARNPGSTSTRSHPGSLEGPARELSTNNFRSRSPGRLENSLRPLARHAENNRRRERLASPREPAIDSRGQ